MSNKPKSRQANIVVQELESEFLIYDLEINKAFCLNETSALVYQLCNGTRGVVEISELMRKKLQILVSEDFVWPALNELKKENLLEDSENLEINFGGVSRREVVKKVGLASMIALPLISSIIAPAAVQAQSGTPPPPPPLSCTPGNCSSPADCQVICPGLEICVATCCCCGSLVGLPPSCL